MRNIFTESNKNKYILTFIAGMILMAGIYEFGMWFFDNYRLRSPLQNPIVPLDISPVNEDNTKTVIPMPSPSKTPLESRIYRGKPLSKVEIVKSSKYPKFIDHIWIRESSRGNNTAGLAGYCNKKGMSNEFGFAVSVNHCFSDFSSSVKRLEKWYENHENLTYNKKLCFYNSGIKTDSCAYLTYNFRAME